MESSPSRFNTLKVLGQGSFGKVFLCLDNHNGGRQVAIKRTKNKLYHSCVQEIAMLSRVGQLKHPNHIVLYEAYTENRCVWMVFEYFDYDLFEFIKQDLVTEHNLKSLFKQLVSGVVSLHQNHIVHQDLKPANILVNKQGVLKIADFNLAILHPHVSRALRGRVCTLWYRPPEVLMNAGHDRSVDVWGMGCILAQMYTKKVLFQGTDQTDTINKIIKIVGAPAAGDWPINACYTMEPLIETPCLLSQILLNAKNDLLNIVTKMLTFNSQRRITAFQALSHPFCA
ncbi:protein ORF121 [Lake sturgeon herpesvirus]|nr:protein ORF121 [Lake sturgeon herpesvirus]